MVTIVNNPQVLRAQLNFLDAKRGAIMAKNAKSLIRIDTQIAKMRVLLAKSTPVVPPVPQAPAEQTVTVEIPATETDQNIVTLPAPKVARSHKAKK